MPSTNAQRFRREVWPGLAARLIWLIVGAFSGSLLVTAVRALTGWW
ncbi:hypothetical protein [Curtobacterium sp. MCBA15_004]|nr:hypothetical protein [Curtobacterium sp. MCBA15_004]WIA97639.1 hypothetical protein QOL16_04390 [Curtobacterium sp. MCBA15_004]